jgi:hypothetical protein
MKNERLTLPAGLRIQVVDNTNLTVPVGTKATISFDDSSSHPICLIDGDDSNSALPMSQCKIIVETPKCSHQ